MELCSITVTEQRVFRIIFHYSFRNTVVRGLLGTDPPDPTLESASPFLLRGGFGIYSTSISWFDPISMQKWKPEEGRARRIRGWGPGGLCHRPLTKIWIRIISVIISAPKAGATEGSFAPTSGLESSFFWGQVWWPHIARYFLSHPSNPPTGCDAPWRLPLHRHISAIPRFATYPAILVRYPPPPPGSKHEKCCDTIAESIANYEKHRYWAS